MDIVFMKFSERCVFIKVIDSFKVVIGNLLWLLI